MLGGGKRRRGLPKVTGCSTRMGASPLETCLRQFRIIAVGSTVIALYPSSMDCLKDDRVPIVMDYLCVLFRDKKSPIPLHYLQCLSATARRYRDIVRSAHNLLSLQGDPLQSEP